MGLKPCGFRQVGPQDSDGFENHEGNLEEQAPTALGGTDLEEVHDRVTSANLQEDEVLPVPRHPHRPRQVSLCQTTRTLLPPETGTDTEEQANWHRVDKVGVHD